MEEIVSTPLGDLTVTPVPLKDLNTGDHFVGQAIGEQRPVYQVTADCRSNPNGWVFVIDLTRPQNAPTFFDYLFHTPVNYVIKGLDQGDCQ